jgi:integrase
MRSRLRRSPGGSHSGGAGLSPARRPYDLRHACLSTWLNGGVYPTQVAEWAGHSVDVLPRIYAKCVVGQDEFAKRRGTEALRQD